MRLFSRLYNYYQFQVRKWPDLQLKSPGIKARSLARHHPQPLVVQHPKQEDSHEDTPTPRTPITTPHTPPHPSDFSVFANIQIPGIKKAFVIL